MTALLKGRHAQGGVAALPAAARQRGTVAPALPMPDPRLGELEAEIARLEAVLADEKRQSARAIEQARREGREQATADDEDRSRMVAQGLADAHKAWNARLADIDLLAVKLARVALAKVFGDAPDMGDRVARTIAHHLGELTADAVVGVRVSGSDFSETMLDELGARIGLGRGRLSVDPDLDEGACRIDLKLGGIDLEPARQWTIIDRALAAMERGE